MNLICEKTTLKSVSRCMYCGSPSFGKGCRYGPKGTHFHPTDPRKCSWCGSPDYGKGCKLNPFNNLHIHGIEYNTMIKENMEGVLQNQLFLSLLKQDITDYQAYKLNLIDKCGNKIKEPITEEEKQSLTPAVKTILRIKKFLGPKLDLIEHVTLLEKTQKIDFNKEKYQKLIAYENKVNDIIEQFHRLVESAYKDGISFEDLENLIQK